MTRLEDFEKLAAVARREPAPALDVAAAVGQRLPLLERTRPDALPWVAALACVSAAAVLGYLGLQAWTALTDPSLGSALSMTAWWLL
jgi:hypothetical protein